MTCKTIEIDRDSKGNVHIRDYITGTTTSVYKNSDGTVGISTSADKKTLEGYFGYHGILEGSKKLVEEKK